VTDIVSSTERSRIMGLVKSKDTRPEMAVRKLCHSAGFRYRLHQKKLPGKPDLVFPARRKIIFVNGCFWHRHPDQTCKLTRTPKSRIEFWEKKFRATIERDQKNISLLENDGWDVLIVWECEVEKGADLQSRILGFLTS